MYNPKQSGFFPLVQLKVEEGISNEDREFYLGLETLEEKVKWIHAMPRISSDHQDNILKNIVKPDFGIKSKEKSVSNRETGNAQFYAGNFKQAQILYSVAVFTAPAPSKAQFLPFSHSNLCNFQYKQKTWFFLLIFIFTK